MHVACIARMYQAPSHAPDLRVPEIFPFYRMSEEGDDDWGDFEEENPAMAVVAATTAESVDPKVISQQRMEWLKQVAKALQAYYKDSVSTGTIEAGKGSHLMVCLRFGLGGAAAALASRVLTGNRPYPTQARLAR